MTQDDITIIIDEQENTPAEVPGTEYYRGPAGKGIASIALHNTTGLTKIYRITFTDNTTYDYSVSDGNDGNPGKSTYQSYLDTTTDNPPMSEAQWANQIGNINAALEALLALEL